MTIRILHTEDIPALRAMHAASCLDYEFPDLSRNMELCVVCCDENDKPMAAVLLERILQAYFICGKLEHPAASKELIRVMHDALYPTVQKLGYPAVDAFLPPSMAVSFGRRLVKHFGWYKNWPSFGLKL